MLARHVSDLTGPSLGAFYKLYVQILYVVIRVLLDTSSRYEVVGRTSYNFVTAGRVEQYAYYHMTNLYIQLVKKRSQR